MFLQVNITNSATVVFSSPLAQEPDLMACQVAAIPVAIRVTAAFEIWLQLSRGMVIAIIPVILIAAFAA